MYGRLKEIAKQLGRHGVMAAGLLAIWPATGAAQSLGNPIPVADVPQALDRQSFFQETPAMLPIAPGPDLPRIPMPFGQEASKGVVQGQHFTTGGAGQNAVHAGGPQAKQDNAIKQAGCTSCSKGVFGSLGAGHGGFGNLTFGNGGWFPKVCGPHLDHCLTGPGQCHPGRPGCCSSHGGCGAGGCNSDSVHGRLLGGLYECLCCPDPCYEPRWVAAANNAFWADSPRPVTQMRLRYDAGFDFRIPDRAEFFWARADGNGSGPNSLAAPGFQSLRYDVINLYNEFAANPRFSLFTNIPYMGIDPNAVVPTASGFSDFSVGTKAVLCDCELFLLTFQFTTFLPVGNAGDGLGTGHVSLEPALLWALKLTPSTYFQGQAAEWIPISGDSLYAGSVFHWHLSLNQILYRFHPDVVLIGSAELNGYSFQDGAYTDPTFGPFQQASTTTYVNVGPGLRLVFCDKLDFGLSAVWSLNDPGPMQIYRSELRVRF